LIPSYSLVFADDLDLRLGLFARHVGLIADDHNRAFMARMDRLRLNALTRAQRIRAAILDRNLTWTTEALMFLLKWSSFSR